ncbi:hypothetical protein Aduo_010784 [Ancylostoma duodenale]
MDRDRLSAIVTNMYIFSGEGLLILVINVPLVLVILILQRLRERKEFLFIAGLAVGDLIYTVGYMSVSIRRIVEFQQDKDNMTATRGDCASDVSNMIFQVGTGVVGEMTLFTALDRLIATLYPIWHFKQQVQYPVIMCMIPILISVVLMAINYHFVMQYSSTEVVSAMCFDSSYPPLRPIFAAHRWGCIILSAFIYVIVSILLYKKFANHLGKGRVTQLNKQQRKNTMHATVTMGLSTLNAILLMLIPDVLLYFRIFTNTSSTYLILYSLILNKIMVNFILFLVRHREFRRVFVGLLSSKKRITGLQTGWSSVNK